MVLLTFLLSPVFVTSFANILIYVCYLPLKITIFFFTSNCCLSLLNQKNYRRQEFVFFFLAETFTKFPEEFSLHNICLLNLKESFLIFPAPLGVPFSSSFFSTAAPTRWSVRGAFVEVYSSSFVIYFLEIQQIVASPAGARLPHWGIITQRPETCSGNELPEACV